MSSVVVSDVVALVVVIAFVLIRRIDYYALYSLVTVRHHGRSLQCRHQRVC